VGSFTNYLENKLLDHVFGGGNYTRPATLYIGLSTSDPGETGSTAGEPSGNGYARVAVVNNATNFPAASGGAKTNGTPIEFPEATGAWGTVTHFFIADNSTGGNVLGYGALNVPKSPTAGDIVYFKANDLDITLT
jgi:hypothetical protein